MYATRGSLTVPPTTPSTTLLAMFGWALGHSASPVWVSWERSSRPESMLTTFLQMEQLLPLAPPQAYI